jgi:hypothetical protein
MIGKKKNLFLGLKKLSYIQTLKILNFKKKHQRNKRKRKEKDGEISLEEKFCLQLIFAIQNYHL